MLTVECFTFNPFQENTYVVYNEQKDCIIIDPGCSTQEEQAELTQFIKEQNLQTINIVLTHSHIDHVYGLSFVKEYYKVPIIGHAFADKGLRSTEMVAKLYGLRVDTPPPIDTTIDEGEELWIGSEQLNILFCPGHAPDHIVLYSANNDMAIVGDVIFHGSIGRTDLPGGDYDTLMESIHHKILVLPSNTVLYSGHGPETTIKEEITNNPFLK